jgi:hypothetical protein
MAGRKIFELSCERPTRNFQVQAFATPLMVDSLKAAIKARFEVCPGDGYAADSLKDRI